MFRDKSCPGAGTSFTLQPQHREPQGGFHAAGNEETKGCCSRTSSHPFRAWTELKSSRQIN